MNAYIKSVGERLDAAYPNETKYLQAVHTWLDQIAPAAADPRYEKLDLINRMAEPERTICFQVAWEDDNHVFHTNHGYRVQFNSAMGPFKGGIRFVPGLDISTVKFLGFEQTFKNALTGLPIGGAAGGSDFDPAGKSDREIMRFCQSFMTAMYRYIGQDTDVPAGDVGVGAREIGFLYGEYKRLSGKAESGAFTGKGITYGGSDLRSEAGGTGVIYFLQKMLAYRNDTIEGKTLALSGFGSMAWGVCKKAAELGAKVVTLSGPDGYVYDPEGVITEEKLNFVKELREAHSNAIAPYAEKFGVKFFPGRKPWGTACDVAIPCAVENEISVTDAKAIIASGAAYYLEAANMATSAHALEILRADRRIMSAGSKAAGCGGVVVSALEMVQDSVRYSWKREEVDELLKKTMNNVFDSSMAAAKEYGLGEDLFGGNCIASFKRVAEAMLAQSL